MNDEDILVHNLIPKHEIMSDSDVEETFKDLEFDVDHLPIIKENDPVSKAIGAKSGDVLRITRDSQTAGTFVTYRLVKG